MKIKTSELIDVQLDWSVSQCPGQWPVIIYERRLWLEQGTRDFPLPDGSTVKLWQGADEWAPSTTWSQGGLIIEQEGIELLCNLTATEAARFKDAHADWQAFYRTNRRTEVRQFATTPLIAAMRCFVASKLGDEVDIPEELL